MASLWVISFMLGVFMAVLVDSLRRLLGFRPWFVSATVLCAALGAVSAVLVGC